MNSDMKQTAVQWLIEQIKKNHSIGYNHITTQQQEQALQMEREQIEEAFNAGYAEAEQDNGVIDTVDMKTVSNASEYYNQTFNQ